MSASHGEFTYGANVRATLQYCQAANRYPSIRPANAKGFVKKTFAGG